MTYKNMNARLATTALAAVLAFSATPLLAQDGSVVPDPIADTPVDAPATTTPDPLAPEETAAPEAAAPEATPAKPVATAKTGTVKHSETTSTRKTTARAATPTLAVAPPAAPVEVSVPAADMTAMVAADPLAEPVAPIAAEPAPAAQADVMDDILPVAGGTALGLLAIGGAAMAMRRRKRRDEEEEFAERQTVLAEAEAEAEAEPEPAARVTEPAFVRTPEPVHDPILADAPVTELPAEFDLSRFGRHVQAAYRGPTEDNPSLSLKNRLRRAAFFDQQERKAAEEAAENRVADLPAARDWSMNRNPEFMLRRASAAPRPSPAYQSSAGLK